MVSSNHFLSQTFVMPVQVAHPGNIFSTLELINSGWEFHRLSPHQDAQAALTTTGTPLATALEGDHIVDGLVTYYTEPIHLHQCLAPGKHSSSSHHHIQDPGVLGFSWMQNHDPQISSKDQEIKCWSTHHHAKCLLTPSINVASTSIDSPETHVQVKILRGYQEFEEVLSKAKATRLLPHHLYDYAIEFLAGAVPLHNHIYPLSAKEAQVMEEYVVAALQWGTYAPRPLQHLPGSSLWRKEGVVYGPA